MNWKIFLTILVVLFLYREWRGSWEDRARKNFNEHFEIFQKLEQMLSGDIHRTFYVGIPGRGTVHQGHGLSKERWTEYIELLNEANLSFMIYVQDEPQKRIVRFYEDSLDGLGYAYMEYPPPKFYKSFNECVPVMPSKSCYVLLRKNWYLYSEDFMLG